MRHLPLSVIDQKYMFAQSGNGSIVGTLMATIIRLRDSADSATGEVQGLHFFYEYNHFYQCTFAFAFKIKSHAVVPHQCFTSSLPIIKKILLFCASILNSKLRTSSTTSITTVAVCCANLVRHYKVDLLQTSLTHSLPYSPPVRSSHVHTI